MTKTKPIQIDEKLHERLKLFAIKNKETMRDATERYIKTGMVADRSKK